MAVKFLLEGTKYGDAWRVLHEGRSAVFIVSGYVNGLTNGEIKLMDIHSVLERNDVH